MMASAVSTPAFRQVWLMPSARAAWDMKAAVLDLLGCKLQCLEARQSTGDEGWLREVSPDMLLSSLACLPCY